MWWNYLINLHIILYTPIFTQREQYIFLWIQLDTLNKRCLTRLSYNTISTHNLKHLSSQIRGPSEQQILPFVQRHTNNSISMPILRLDAQPRVYVL